MPLLYEIDARHDDVQLPPGSVVARVGRQHRGKKRQVASRGVRCIASADQENPENSLYETVLGTAHRATPRSAGTGSCSMALCESGEWFLGSFDRLSDIHIAGTRSCCSRRPAGKPARVVASSDTNATARNAPFFISLSKTTTPRSRPNCWCRRRSSSKQTRSSSGAPRLREDPAIRSPTEPHLPVPRQRGSVETTAALCLANPFRADDSRARSRVTHCEKRHAYPISDPFRRPWRLHQDVSLWIDKSLPDTKRNHFVRAAPRRKCSIYF